MKKILIKIGKIVERSSNCIVLTGIAIIFWPLFCLDFILDDDKKKTIFYEFVSGLALHKYLSDTFKQKDSFIFTKEEFEEFR